MDGDPLMGTRADFYIGGTDPEKMRWLGSIAWDGYPDGLPNVLLRATNEAEWEAFVTLFLGGRDDATLPDQGWPWPWPDSRTTDYAYTWDEEDVLASNFGKPWYCAIDPDETPVGEARFPDMTAIQNIAWDGRSGLIIVEVREDRDE